MKTLSSFANEHIGTVFTPAKWAKFAIEKYGLLDAWLGGKTIFDPTMGCGALLCALTEAALEAGQKLSTLPFKNLYGVELNKTYYEKALDDFKNNYDVDMSGNFYNRDILVFNDIKADVLLGNPPWCNFTDLPQSYKEQVKPLFYRYELIENARKLLLGGSRIDIAALVIQKTISENLNANGSAIFFLPLSLFLNDGAHSAFRKFKVKTERYFLHSIYDFEGIDVFENIATRYGLACFNKQPPHNKRIPYYCFENAAWRQKYAAQNGVGGAYLVAESGKEDVQIPRIAVPKEAKPRQGINPCGALSVFVFNAYSSINDKECVVNDNYILPKKYIYPLITSKNFSGDEDPKKWVLLPYTKNGKPLSLAELVAEPLLKQYLFRHKTILTNRKGLMINAHIKRGLWWALLGVGTYNFCAFKIVWEAYGKKTFIPKIFLGTWQANQSLQAFIPCKNIEEARSILSELQNPLVERYLAASKMAGTMCWAQPGKIAALLDFKKSGQELF